MIVGIVPPASTTNVIVGVVLVLAVNCELRLAGSGKQTLW